MLLRLDRIKRVVVGIVVIGSIDTVVGIVVLIQLLVLSLVL